MSLKEKVDTAIKTAMKAKDTAGLRALRAIKSAILLVETSENRNPGPLSENEELTLLTKQAKQRKDAIEQFQNNQREDLAKIELEELSIIETFLPQSLSDQELENVLHKVLSDNNLKNSADFGKAMKLASQNLAGQADNQRISQLLKKLLN